MSKLHLLLRLNRLELLGINKRLNDPARRRSAVVLIALIALGGVAALGVAFLYCMAIGYALSMMNALSALPSLLVSVTAITAFITTIFKAPDALFRTRDLDMLLSMPIPVRTVATARVLKIYGMNLLVALLILLPGGAAYAVLASPPGWFYPVYLLIALAAPMIPTVLASLVGALVTLAGASIKRLRYAGLVLMLIALVGIVVLSGYLSTSSANVQMLMNFARGLIDMLTRVYPLAGLCTRAVPGGDALAAVVYIAASVATLLVGGAAFSKGFLRLRSLLGAHARGRRFVLGRQKARSARAALLSREWRHFLSINSYVLNSAFGPVLSLVAVIALALFVPVETITAIFGLNALGGMPMVVLPFLVSWLIGIGPTTASSVSLEGKSLWLVKSLPVAPRDWLLPKLWLNLELFAPFAIIDSVVIAWVFRAQGMALAVLLLMPLLMGVFSALLGLIINCKFPRFDWTSEAKVAKNSAGVIAVVVVSMVLCYGGMYLSLWLTPGGEMTVPALFTAALALACVGMYALVCARAQRWVANMQV